MRYIEKLQIIEAYDFSIVKEDNKGQPLFDKMDTEVSYGRKEYRYYIWIEEKGDNVLKEISEYCFIIKDGNRKIIMRPEEFKKRYEALVPKKSFLRKLFGF